MRRTFGTFVNIIFNQGTVRRKMSERIAKIEQSLLKELECPVCFDLMLPPIALCQNGHSVCSTCRPNLDRCPSCRKSFLEIRNLTLENIARCLMHPCKNAKAGCLALLPESQLREHEDECSYGSYVCPFSKVSQVYCLWDKPLSEIKRHVLRDHKKTSVEIYGGGKFYSHLTNFSREFTMNKAILVFGELFYAQWKAYQRTFYCMVFYVGPRKNASKYTYKFSLTKNNKRENLSMSMKTSSYMENEAEVMKPGRCIIFHYSVIEQFLADGNKLPFELEISKIGRNAPGAANNDSSDDEFENAERIDP